MTLIFLLSTFLLILINNSQINTIPTGLEGNLRSHAIGTTWELANAVNPGPSLLLPVGIRHVMSLWP
jgi:hypothetical protein